MFGISKTAGKWLMVGVVGASMLTFPAITAASQDSHQQGASCTGASTGQLQVNREYNRLQVEFNVQTSVNGQAWQVTLKHNGHRLWRGSRYTHEGGSFDVQRLSRNALGTDTFFARAVNKTTGEVCTATVQY
jgi:hypothetical protein